MQYYSLTTWAHNIPHFTNACTYDCIHKIVKVLTGLVYWLDITSFPTKARLVSLLTVSENGTTLSITLLLRL